MEQKLFPSLNDINGKTSTYGSKGIIRKYCYRSDPKLGPGIVAIIIIICSFQSCIEISSISWYYTIKETFSDPIYVIV